MTIGTIQRVTCYRIYSTGHQETSWQRDMFVPSGEDDEFFKQFTAPIGASFSYQTRRVQVCFRKPRNITHWRE